MTWLLIGFLAGHPILMTDLPSERRCLEIARALSAGFGTGAQVHVECRASARPNRATRVYE
jgi:hypothetical protein